MELTKTQEQAINHFRGPALVIAGPGAGKTFVITERVKELISERKIDPTRILVTTFTNKAADELKVKLARTVGKDAELIHISTIHSFCKSMLEKYFLYHDYGATIDVLDEESHKLFLDIHKVDLGISHWEKGVLKNLKHSFNYIGDIKSFYDKITETQIDTEKLIQSLKAKNELLDEDLKIIQGYKKYLDLLHVEKQMDFALLQTKFYNLLIDNSEVLNSIRNDFEFILVDEYQDTSPIQDNIFRLIAGKKQNLFVVGDENQSIYGFRGASLKNFRNFIKRYPKSKSYLLNVNFRSTKTIVDFSNQVFEKEIRKVLKAIRRKGEKIKIISEEDSDSTAKKSVELIKKLKDEGIIKKYGDVVLLFRSLRRHSPEYVKYLEKENIPFVTFGDGKFLEREEIRTLLYLMSYVTQELYFENKFHRWKNWWKKDLFLTDFFGFSPQTKKVIIEGSFNLYELRDDDDFKKVGFTNADDILKLKKLNKLKYDVEREKDSFGDQQRGKNSLLRVFYKILDYSGYFEKLMAKETDKEKEILFNLGKLSEIISRYMEISKKEDVKNFLWYIYGAGDDIDQSKIEDEFTVKLMTVHKAKGLEFPVVFLCCLNEGRFPLHFRDRYLIPIPDDVLDKEEIKDEKEEFFQEERRLFYVGITRAQDDLILTASQKHIVNRWDKSRFLKLIPADLITDNDFRLATEKTYRVPSLVPSLNYSAINTFIDCPLRYTLIYDYGFVTPPSFMQRLGSFIHNTLQQIHESMKKKHDIIPSEMKEIVDKYWIDLPLSKEKNDQIKQSYIKKFVTYYLAAKDDYKEILAIEQSFSHIDDNMIVDGKVDLITKNKEGRVCLVDFKARKSEGIEKTNVDKQLQIYHHCLNNKYNIDRLIAHTFEDNKQTDFPINQQETTQFLQSISKKMGEKNFHKQKGDFCPQCQFSFYCWSKTA